MSGIDYYYYYIVAWSIYLNLKFGPLAKQVGHPCCRQDLQTISRSLVDWQMHGCQVHV